MRLCDLRDVYRGQDLYIIGTAPTINTFPMDFFEGKICLSLNDAYKLHPAIAPVALMHHEIYAHTSKKALAPFHEGMERIKYPIVKGSSRKRREAVDWENPLYYYYDWSVDIENIWTMTKDTDYLYYTPDGCSLQAALQIAWIMGAKNVFIAGCDSRVMGGKHYANYNKDGIRDEEIPKRGGERNYDSYVYGELLAMEFLKRKGVNVFNLSTLIGYHMVDFQFDFLRGGIPLERIYEEVRKLRETAGL